MRRRLAIALRGHTCFFPKAWSEDAPVSADIRDAEQKPRRWEWRREQRTCAGPNTRALEKGEAGQLTATGTGLAGVSPSLPNQGASSIWAADSWGSGQMQRYAVMRWMSPEWDRGRTVGEGIGGLSRIRRPGCRPGFLAGIDPR